MKRLLSQLWVFLPPNIIATFLLLVCVTTLVKAEARHGLPVSKYGAPVLDAKGRHINYDRNTLEAIAHAKQTPIKAAGNRTRTSLPTAVSTPRPQPSPRPRPTPPPPFAGRQPFWQYAVFGADIGGSNIIIAPVPQGGGTPEIIFDSYSYSTFWQSIRYNPSTGNYDQVFVSPSYNTDPYSYVSIRGLQLAKVTNASDQ